jgi:dihydroorotate dehydrogenase electron transfer subunit
MNARADAAMTQAARSTVRLSGRDDLGRGYQRLCFESDRPLQAQAGHFAMIRGDTWGSAPLLPRPMSLLSAGAQPSMLVKVVGQGTTLMATAPLGERFTLLAPLGMPWPTPAPKTRLILVAGGVGLAPLLFLARQLSEHPQDEPVPMLGLYGGRSQGDLPLADELGAVTELRVATEDGSRGTRGLVTKLLEVALAEARSQAERIQIYACGPHPMMAAVAQLAQQHQAPCTVSLEAMMGCGYGVCLGCAVPRRAGGYLYACTEGPCVPAQEVDWQRGPQP